MLVADNPSLNILLPKENKALKTVLKEADTKALQQMVQNKSTSANEVLKNLFDQVKNESKANTTIENMLKNSSLLKELGSFSKSTATLLNQIDSNSNLTKFKPLLENFLKDIKNLDANTLKEQLGKSGVFLESKIAQSIGKNSSLNTQLEKLLNQIQTIIKDINTPQAKQINDLILKIVDPNTQASNTNQTANIKNLVSLLQNTSTTLADKGTLNLSNLTNQLSSLIEKGSLLESKIQNTQSQNLQNSQVLENKNILNIQAKELLSQIRGEVLNNNSQNQIKNLLPQIDSLIKTNDLFLKNDNLIEGKTLSNLQTNISNNISTFTSNFAINLSNLLISLKNDIANLSTNQNNTNTQNSLLKIIDKIENILKENSVNTNINQNISNDMKSILLQMQDDLLSKMDPKSQEILKQVDKMLVQIDYHQLLSHTGSSNNVYIPFLWDMLEDGSINMKKINEEKFYCQINLTLKDFGKVDLMMAMYDKNKIDLTIYAQREHFKVAVRDNLTNLKKALNDIDLIPVNIKLLDLKEEKQKTNIEKKTQEFVNPYNLENVTSVDIRV